MFAVVSKMYGCAKSASEEWTFNPASVTAYTLQAANSIADPFWNRVEPIADFLAKLERFHEMAKAPRGRPAKANTQAQELMAALEFVSVACGQHEFWHSHARLGGNFVVAFNGQLAAGHPIVEELECCPHIERLKSAIGKCGKSLSITQTAGGKLSIKGDKLNALVPCLPTADLPETAPDAPAGAIGDVFKEAFRVCGSLTTEAATEVIKASILLEANVCTGTNRHAIIQFWHGYNLPPNIVLPKAFTAAIAKQTKAITGFGFRWYDAEVCNKVGRLTFHFEGGAWISTVCYADDWPSLEAALAGPASPVEPPAGLWEGMGAVADFNDISSCTLVDGKVQSHRSELEGAQYDVPGLQGGKQLDPAMMLKVAPHIKTWDYTTHPTKVLFFGGESANPVRGAVACIVENGHGEEREMTVEQAEAYIAEEELPDYGSGPGHPDDIPL